MQSVETNGTWLPNDPKIFCVGAGKTGTTSLESLFKSLGYHVGDQARGERLLRKWAAGDYEPIVELCRTAQVFQDIPFNCPGTFRVLDAAFPQSRFILSVRDSEQWYASLTRFHTLIVGKGRLPTTEDLRTFPYRHEGWILDALRAVYDVTESDPYRKSTLIQAYERHNEDVKWYFADRNESLLVVNVSEADAAQRIVEFTGSTYRGETMPHENRSAQG